MPGVSVDVDEDLEAEFELLEGGERDLGELEGPDRAAARSARAAGSRAVVRGGSALGCADAQRVDDRAAAGASASILQL